MNIKDFKVGDTVYIVGGDRASDKTIRKETVSKVGRKYVSIGSGWAEDKFEIPEYIDNANYLVEHKDWGTRRELFKSMEDIETKREAERIKKWLFGSYGGAQRHKYTLSQLRMVRDILNPNGEYDDEIGS